MIIEGDLGHLYHDGEVITQQGDVGNTMFVVQQGEVQISVRTEHEELVLSVLERGDVFGEMALFTHSERSATARALGDARVLTVDKRKFMKRVHQDPSLAYRILRKMSERIQRLNRQVVELRSELEQRSKAAEEPKVHA